MRGMADASTMDLVENPQAGKLHVEFDTLPELDEAASETAGHPVFSERDYIRIIVPGDKDNVVHRRVWMDVNNPNSDIRFQRQYEAWKLNKAAPINGFPLTEWPPMKKSEVALLEHFGVKTVEGLANVSDGNLQKMGPGVLALRQKAKDFLEASKGQAPLQQMRAELEDRDSRISTLEKALKEQGDRLEQLNKRK